MARGGHLAKTVACTVNVACGLIPDKSMYENLSTDIRLEVFEVGDCVTPHKIIDAIREGHTAAKLLD